ncbi:MAG: KEOPS complex subunit Cgi121 [Bacteroidales bacterium]|nr:KEOPS complex subunit Cgi121 [Bacteroidales bacterium]
MNIQIISGTINITNLPGFLRQLADIGEGHNITVQAVNADLLTGSRHLMFAVEKAIRSFDSGRNIANNLGMEIMLYAAGTRQIERALGLGVRMGENRIAMVLVGENGIDDALVHVSELLDTVDPIVLDYSDIRKKDIQEFFTITSDELETVDETKIPELVLERVALVDVVK